MEKRRLAENLSNKSKELLLNPQAYSVEQTTLTAFVTQMLEGNRDLAYARVVDRDGIILSSGLIDEIFTPDSSRFWPANDWEPGREQPSFDKQIVRNYLETVVEAGEWDKTPPGPLLPDEVVERSIARYLEAYELLTGSTLSL